MLTFSTSDVVAKLIASVIFATMVLGLAFAEPAKATADPPTKPAWAIITVTSVDGMPFLMQFFPYLSERECSAHAFRLFLQQGLPKLPTCVAGQLDADGMFHSERKKDDGEDTDTGTERGT